MHKPTCRHIQKKMSWSYGKCLTLTSKIDNLIYKVHPFVFYFLQLHLQDKAYKANIKYSKRKPSQITKKKWNRRNEGVLHNFLTHPCLNMTLPMSYQTIHHTVY